MVGGGVGQLIDEQDEILKNILVMATDKSYKVYLRPFFLTNHQKDQGRIQIYEITYERGYNSPTILQRTQVTSTLSAIIIGLRDLIDGPFRDRYKAVSFTKKDCGVQIF